MYRTHDCGALRLANASEQVTLSGWVSRTRDKGFMVWIDLRDRYGITQLVLDQERCSAELLETARSLGRETVIQVKGLVIKRDAKNAGMPTGEVEVLVAELKVLNAAKLPPFTIEDQTDGGDELRMKYRYLDIRRNPVKQNLIFRHKVSMLCAITFLIKGFSK
jgi:Aspartyl-tRNA synthetase